MSTSSRRFLLTLSLPLLLLTFTPVASAESAAVPAATPVTPVTTNSSPSLRPRNESRACQKAKKTYAATRRKRRVTSPLQINEDRRAVLEACGAMP